MIGVIILIILVFLNAYFVAAEFALVQTKRARLESLDIPASRRVLKQLDNINTYLSSCQVGITMASIAIGFIGEKAIADLLEPIISGVVGHTGTTIISFILAYAVVTALHIVIGEQVPKIYAIQRAERISMLLARPLNLFTVTLKPVIWSLSAVSSAILRVMGINAESSHGEAASPAELRAMIDSASAGGVLDYQEAGMLSGVFRLHEQEVREVMTPAPNVTHVPVNTSVKEAAQLCIDCGHTRLIVMNEDDVVGVVNLSQLTECLLAESQQTVGDLATQVPMVPETKPLDELLKELQRTYTSIAIVLDEYGRMIGIVTIEDIVEEAVGDIRDETDVDEATLRPDDQGRWNISGETSLADLTDAGLHLPVDTDSFNSIGGYVFSELGRLPEIGDEVISNGYLLTVTEMDEHRISEIVLSIREDSTHEDNN